MVITTDLSDGAPDWADKKCDCGAYLEEPAITYPYGDEEVCEGCNDAIAGAQKVQSEG